MKYNTESFIYKAKQIHGEQYDYSKVELKRISKDPVCICCKKHGEFMQLPYVHLKGSGCPVCGIESRKMNADIFFDKVNAKHSNKYDYSNSSFVDMNTPIEIICPVHGKFTQKPKYHLISGCPKCGREICRPHKKTTQEFINDAIKVHGKIYDYTNVNYSSCIQKVEIICSEHGSFYQTPQSHLAGCGCPKCGRLQQIQKATLTQDEFIQKAKNVHGSLYDYSKTMYKGYRYKIDINCNKHGLFTQDPMQHLKGAGCPICNFSKLELLIKKTLDKERIHYIMQARTSLLPWLGLQSLDFYLPDKHIAIECQGKQHFESVNLWGGNDGLQHRQELDLLKRNKCEKNGVLLLYFSDKKYDDNIITDINVLLKIIKES